MEIYFFQLESGAFFSYCLQNRQWQFENSLSDINSKYDKSVYTKKFIKVYHSVDDTSEYFMFQTKGQSLIILKIWYNQNIKSSVQFEIVDNHDVGLWFDDKVLCIQSK